MIDHGLSEIKLMILHAIIKTYLETGEPVGSRTISKFADVKLSSATIRNEMSDLEEMGYIMQPHTSAGRIPSDKGYRLYVDMLMSEKEQELQEKEEQMLEKIALRQAISQLPQRERSVVELRYFHGLTQQRVAKILDVSQVQVSRIEKKAVELLRELLV